MLQVFRATLGALQGKAETFSREFIAWLREFVGQVNTNTSDIEDLDARVDTLEAEEEVLEEEVEEIQADGVRADIREVEVHLGASPVKSGSFEIADDDITDEKLVIVMQAPSPYTGKGSSEDESEMDTVLVTATAGDGVARARWKSATLVRGNFKFNYMVN